MRILFIYPNAHGYQRIPLGISILITTLKVAGHDVELFDTTFMRPNLDNELREKAGFVKPTEKVNSENLTDDQIARDLYHRVIDFKPEIICASIVEDNYRFCNFLLGSIREFTNSPVIVGGATPTVASEVLIENPNIDYVVKGEAEPSLLYLIVAIKYVRFNVPNILFSGVSNLNILPIQDLSLWDERHFIKPYDGKVYKAGFIESSRGCFNNCTYCINRTWKKVCDIGKRDSIRYKRIDKVIEEAVTLKEKYNFNMFFFTDDDFLFIGDARCKEFCERWKEEVNLPYWINTRVEVVTQFKARHLKFSGCVGIGFGVESGSQWLRENILNRKGIDNNKIAEAFDIVKAYGIRTTANFMLGFPGETVVDIEQTIDLARRINADSIDVTFVSPYYGTDIHRVCSTLGYIEVEDKLGFKGMAKNISMRAKPVISIPFVPKYMLEGIYRNFQHYVNGREFWRDCRTQGILEEFKKC